MNDKICQVQINGDKPCQIRKCPHNFFYDGVFQGNTLFNPNETEVSREFQNCMIFLDREIPFGDIAEMYGVTPERICQIYEEAIRKLRKRTGVKAGDRVRRKKENLLHLSEEEKRIRFKEQRRQAKIRFDLRRKNANR